MLIVLALAPVAALGVNITGFEPLMPMTEFLNTPDVVRTTDVRSPPPIRIEQGPHSHSLNPLQCVSNCTLAQTAITVSRTRSFVIFS